MLNKKKNNKGFTLVELLVVIAIIGILAVVAVPALFSNINKAKVADMEADYSAFKSAALSYYSDENQYTGIETSVSVLDAYMESRPVNDPFGGTYSVDADASEGKLVLIATLNNKALGTKEITKLKNDLGNNVVIEPSGSNTGIKLVLIK